MSLANQMHGAVDPAGQRLEALVTRTRRRAALGLAARGAAVGAGLAAVGVGLGLGPAAWAALPLSMLAVVAARMPSPSEVVSTLDAHLGAQDALACAWDRRDLDAPIVALQRHRTVQGLDEGAASGAVPWPSAAWLAPALLWAWPIWAPTSVEAVGGHGDAGEVAAHLDGGATKTGRADPKPGGEPIRGEEEAGRPPEAATPDAEPGGPDAETPPEAQAPDAGGGPGGQVAGSEIKAPGVGGQAGDAEGGAAGRLKTGGAPDSPGEALAIPRRAGTSAREMEARWIAAGEAPLEIRRGGQVVDPARPWPERHRPLITAWLRHRAARAPEGGQR